MLYQHPTEFTYNFQVQINSSNQSNITTIVDAADVFSSISPDYSTGVTGTCWITSLQANFYLPSLRVNPYPQINDLASESLQTAQMVEHKTKYNPQTGHAVEIQFYDRGSTDWRSRAREYLYNLGLFEQYLPLISPYFSLSEKLALGKNSRIAASITSGSLGVDDYIIIHGTIQGVVSCFFIPNITTYSSGDAGTVDQNEIQISQPAKRSTFLLTNGGPGRLFVAPSKILAGSRRCAWIEPNNSLSWEGANFDISYTGNNANINLFKLGGLIPDSEIWVSSDSVADYGFYQNVLAYN